jgi:AraC family transcriptional regulator of adaptative response / DNA-3-methyladenine glycosylase II
VAVTLGYREPFDWDGMLAFFALRAVPGVELVRDRAYARTARVGDRAGLMRVSPSPDRAALRLEVSPALAPALMPLAARARRMFDLDASPEVVRAHLAKDRVLARAVGRAPGLRVPGAFDAFEIAVRAVLGQQISVRAATTLAGRLADRFGEQIDAEDPALTRRFPTAEHLSRQSAEHVATIGLPAARARTLVTLARAVASGRLDLGLGADPEEVSRGLEALPGIGRWTADYVAMRALGAPDAFPDGDLGLRCALGGISSAALRERAEQWRPWRAYAAIHLWSASSGGG